MKSQTFGERLKESRQSSNLTQKQVSKKVGIAQSTLSQLEGGAFPASRYTPRLAHLFGVSARWLADGEGPKAVGDTGGSSDPPWPFNRVTEAQFASLPHRIKADIEDYIEMKLAKAASVRV
jgi:transcriptional regulator with XRE-family HTH domain